MIEAFHTAVATVFGGDTPSGTLNVAQVAARSVFVFLLGLTLVRIGKSRMLSGATALDVILGFIVGSVLSRAITGSASLSGTAAATATLVALHWVFTALAIRSHWWGNLIKGRSYLLVADGKMLTENMARSHTTENDLKEALRLNANLDDIQQVKCAYKERSGDLGIVKRPSEPQVCEIQVHDGVQTVRIAMS